MEDCKDEWGDPDVFDFMECPACKGVVEVERPEPGDRVKCGGCGARLKVKSKE